MRPRLMLDNTSHQTSVRSDLFPDTSHSPSLAELVGYERAADIVDFCFIANPYYPTPQMISASLQEALPGVDQVLPVEQSGDDGSESLAEVLGVDRTRSDRRQRGHSADRVDQ
jgi:threonine-phosphate decarboxylase